MHPCTISEQRGKKTARKITKKRHFFLFHLSNVEEGSEVCHKTGKKRSVKERERKGGDSGGRARWGGDNIRTFHKEAAVAPPPPESHPSAGQPPPKKTAPRPRAAHVTRASINPKQVVAAYVTSARRRHPFLSANDKQNKKKKNKIPPPKNAPLPPTRRHPHNLLGIHPLGFFFFFFQFSPPSLTPPRPLRVVCPF